MMDKNESQRLFLNWFPIIVYCIVIFIQSSHPPVTEAPSLPHADKLLHLAGYALLGALFLRGFKRSRYKNYPVLTEIMSILLTGLYGASDELHQYFVPFRSADVGDILFDLLGGIFGVYLYQLLLERYPRIRRI